MRLFRPRGSWRGVGGRANLCGQHGDTFCGVGRLRGNRGQTKKSSLRLRLERLLGTAKACLELFVHICFQSASLSRDEADNEPNHFIEKMMTDMSGHGCRWLASGLAISGLGPPCQAVARQDPTRPNRHASHVGGRGSFLN